MTKIKELAIKIRTDSTDRGEKDYIGDIAFGLVAGHIPDIAKSREQILKTLARSERLTEEQKKEISALSNEGLSALLQYAYHWNGTYKTLGRVQKELPGIIQTNTELDSDAISKADVIQIQAQYIKGHLSQVGELDIDALSRPEIMSSMRAMRYDHISSLPDLLSWSGRDLKLRYSHGKDHRLYDETLQLCAVSISTVKGKLGKVVENIEKEAASLGLKEAPKQDAPGAAITAKPEALAPRRTARQVTESPKSRSNQQIVTEPVTRATPAVGGSTSIKDIVGALNITGQHSAPDYIGYLAFKISHISSVGDEADSEIATLGAEILEKLQSSSELTKGQKQAIAALDPDSFETFMAYAYHCKTSLQSARNNSAIVAANPLDGLGEEARSQAASIIANMGLIEERLALIDDLDVSTLGEEETNEQVWGVCLGLNEMEVPITMTSFQRLKPNKDESRASKHEKKRLDEYGKAVETFSIKMGGLKGCIVEYTEPIKKAQTELADFLIAPRVEGAKASSVVITSPQTDIVSREVTPDVASSETKTQMEGVRRGLMGRIIDALKSFLQKFLGGGASSELEAEHQKRYTIDDRGEMEDDRSIAVSSAQTMEGTRTTSAKAAAVTPKSTWGKQVTTQKQDKEQIPTR